MKLSRLLITILAVASGLLSLNAQEKKSITDKAPDPPQIFEELDDAQSAAKDSGKSIFIVCLKQNDPDSIAVDKLIKENSIYLDPDELVIFRYHVADDKLIDSFRSHFKVTKDELPIVVLADAWATPLGHLTGRYPKGAYTAWVRKTGGNDFVDIPPDGLFNVKAETLVTTKDIIDSRTWTFISGKRINAALVEANGSKGTFRTDNDDYLEVDFNHLIEADKAYLSTRLPSTGSDTFP